MRGFINVVPRFFTAFAISAVIIASFAAVSVLGDDGMALSYNSDTKTFTVFGEEYGISPKFVSVTHTVYDFNETFLGRNWKKVVDKTLMFCADYAVNAFRFVFGISEAVLNNCT